MNYSIILYILGCLLKFEAGFLLLPVLIGIIYKEDTLLPYLTVAAFCLILGFLLAHKKPTNKNLFIKEGKFYI